MLQVKDYTYMIQQSKKYLRWTGEPEKLSL